MAHGEPLNTVYRLDRADVILALDSDFLHSGPGCVRYLRDFAARRRPGVEGRGMNRLYAMESAYTLTGAAADHRLAVRASDLEACALRLASELEVAAIRGRAAPSLGPERDRWIGALARDLRRAGPNGLVIAGDGASAMAHALAHGINVTLGAAGGTSYLTDPLEAEPAAGSLGALLEDVEAGKVKLLVMLGGNPVHAAPDRLDVASRIEKAKLRVHLSLHADETSRICHWHIPEAHWLESWGDARAHDGTVSMIQPLIAPLYGGKSAHEVIGAMLGEPAVTTHDAVRAHWTGGAPAARDARQAAGAEEAWLRAIHDGFIAGSALPPRDVPLR
jgi:molybdopterin-containing oxidoreductase family iron-sulfur binding subunit